MFEQFLRHVEFAEKSSFQSEKDFCECLAGKTFLNGMYRLFRKDQIAKWTEIVERSFPAYRSRIDLFGFDWLGQVFARNKDTDTVLWFQPGIGEVLDIPCSFTAFHDVEIVESPEDALVSRYFEYWFENNDHYILKHNECVSYKVPLFLNGNDDIDNLEVSDMEVYWEIMMPLLNL